MKKFKTPRESPTKTITKININNKPFNQIQFNRNQHNDGLLNLKTLSPTPFYKSKSNRRFNFNIPKLNSQFNKFNFNIPKLNSQFNKNYELEQKNKNFYKKLLEIKTHNNPKKFSAKNLFNSHWKKIYLIHIGKPVMLN